MRQGINEDESIMTKSIYITVKCYTKEEKSSSVQIRMCMFYLQFDFTQKHDFNLFPAESEMKGTRSMTRSFEEEGNICLRALVSQTLSHTKKEKL